MARRKNPFSEPYERQPGKGCPTTNAAPATHKNAVKQSTWSDSDGDITSSSSSSDPPSTAHEVLPAAELSRRLRPDLVSEETSVGSSAKGSCSQPGGFHDVEYLETEEELQPQEEGAMTDYSSFEHDGVEVTPSPPKPTPKPQKKRVWNGLSFEDAVAKYGIGKILAAIRSKGCISGVNGISITSPSEKNDMDFDEETAVQRTPGAMGKAEMEGGTAEEVMSTVTPSGDYEDIKDKEESSVELDMVLQMPVDEDHRVDRDQRVEHWLDEAVPKDSPLRNRPRRWKDGKQ